MNVTGAIAVAEASQVAEGRRLALWLGSHLDFTEERSGRAALVASELATNLAKHARSGELLFRKLTTPDGQANGMEILALDKGPGIPDVALSRRDGYSTGGTLGHGLGAVHRVADECEIYTHTSGSVIAARIWRDGPPSPLALGRYEVGAVNVSKTGEDVCGDAWSWRMREGRLAVFIADGLGHGLSAHEAATTATRMFAQSHELPPARLIEDVHAALRATRGAAVAALVIDVDRRIGMFAGLGNISGVVLVPAGRHSMVSHNGTAGHNAGRIQAFTYPIPADAVVVMFSDGLATHWDLSAYPGLRLQSASLIAGVLYRDFSRRRDDVTVVVVRERPHVAEKL